MSSSAGEELRRQFYAGYGFNPHLEQQANVGDELARDEGKGPDELPEHLVEILRREDKTLAAAQPGYQVPQTAMDNSDWVIARVGQRYKMDLPVDSHDQVLQRLFDGGGNGGPVGVEATVVQTLPVATAIQSTTPKRVIEAPKKSVDSPKQTQSGAKQLIGNYFKAEMTRRTNLNIDAGSKHPFMKAVAIESGKLALLFSVVFGGIATLPSIDKDDPVETGKTFVHNTVAPTKFVIGKIVP